MATKIQRRRDIAINWTNANPVLADGEIGYEKGTDKEKIGNGVSTWNQLPYRTMGITGGGSTAWDDITNKPDVVLSVNGETPDVNGAVTIDVGSAIPTVIKYFKSGVLTTSIGTYKKYIPYTTFTLASIKSSVNVVGGVSFVINKNGTPIVTHTMGAGDYLSTITNTTSFVSGDYITVDITNTTTSENLLLEFIGTEG